MPTYEYRCAACKREFEYQHSMNDPDLVKCEACGEDKLERLISWTSVRSDLWRGALFKDNPKEAMKGLHPVDKSKEQRFRGNEAVAAVDSGTGSDTGTGVGSDTGTGSGTDAEKKPNQA